MQSFSLGAEEEETVKKEKEHGGSWGRGGKGPGAGPLSQLDRETELNANIWILQGQRAEAWPFFQFHSPKDYSPPLVLPTVPLTAPCPLSGFCQGNAPKCLQPPPHPAVNPLQAATSFFPSTKDLDWQLFQDLLPF